MKDLRFIKHATDTLHNNQFALLIQKEGYKGYGIYWALMENLFGQPQYQSPLQTIGLLATRLGLRKTVLLRIIKEYGLFQLTETHFAAPQLANSQQRTTRACQQAGTTEQVSLRKEEEHTNLGQTQTNLPQSAGKHTLNEHTTGTQRNYLPCNSLTINKTSDTQEKTREEKEKKKNTHTQKNVRQRETVARDEKKDRNTNYHPGRHPPGTTTHPADHRADTPADTLAREHRKKHLPRKAGDPLPATTAYRL